MLRHFALLLVSSLLLTYSHPDTSSPTPMTPSTDLHLYPITLKVREEQRLPAGAPPQRDRDIGFATVFLQLENRQDSNQTITIDQIQIQDMTTGQIYMTTPQAQTINLRPLEHSAQDFHLTNRIGFAGPGPVRAVISYSLAGRQESLISGPIGIDHF